MYRIFFIIPPSHAIVNLNVRFTGIILSRNYLWSFKMTNHLGDKIRKHRKKQGLTLDKLATSAKLSKSYLWELENRESQSPSAEKLASIADALKVTTNYLLENDNRDPDEKHLDDAFFRGYKNLEGKDKEQLRKILDAFKKE